MKFWMAAFVGLMLTVGPAYANDQTSAEDLSVGESESLALDTTETFGLEGDTFSHGQFLCYASSALYGGYYMGRDENLYRAKLKALFSCYKRTHQRCKIQFCRKTFG